MSPASSEHRTNAERLYLYALQALPANELALAEAHIAACAECRQELEHLRPIVAAFKVPPTELLRPSNALLGKLAERIAPAKAPSTEMTPAAGWVEPPWTDVAPGIACKILATDIQTNRVSMLVRLAPGTDYPPHRHAGVEELHLLDGELWINERKFYPGDYNRAEAGSADQRVWSETGCICVLITSPNDALFK
jgi:anti-sigma factor ChrR (cupin superfamily)